MKRPAWIPALSRRRRRLIQVVLVVAFVAMFLTVSVPSWQRAGQDARQIEAASTRIESMNGWAVAGLWLDEAARRWRPEQDAVYARRFPPRKEREQLFLDLALAAREAGIDPLTLREAEVNEDEADPPPEETAADPAVSDLVSRFLPDDSGLPSAKLATYRLTAAFDADYARLAAFLGGLRRIDRAVNVRRLTAVPSVEAITVEMELEFYAQSID